MRTHILAAAAAVIAVLGLAATAQAQPATHPPRAATTAAVSAGPVTMSGPHMYDPATHKPFAHASIVTVSQTTNLVNQMVHVSWRYFTPSSSTIYNPSNADYPVMITECKGINPASPADCYGAENGGVVSTSGPFGTMNDAYATTGPNGSGSADIDIFTWLQNGFLGCDHTHPCSLAIVPAQGGDIYKTPPDCADHSLDTGFGGTAAGELDFNSSPNDYLCSWAKRIVFPLNFARTAASCPFQRAAFTAAGSPMLQRAMDSWLAALCTGAHGTAINYTAALSEPQALAELGSGQADVALTTRTAEAQGISTGSKQYVYAPVAVSAMSVAYWFDNPETGQPQTGVRLDQRLLLKLLTTSYAFDNDGCPINPPPPIGCDHGVDHDAASLFADPEFQALNPDITAPVNGPVEVPTVVAGQSDTTWTVTRWIAANKAADRFLAGHRDPYGEHIDRYYSGLRYPANVFIGQDPYPLVAWLYNPIFPFSQVATDQAENWPPEYSFVKDPLGNHERLPAQPAGERALIALTGQGDAAADLFPVAAIPNATGHFVRPTDAAMAAAVRTMVPAGDDTLQVNLHSKNPAVYPLTMVIYAAAPISGTSHAKAAAIARFIDYAAGAGQVRGDQAGQLPAGFLPLTPDLRTQAREDAKEVLHQTGG